RHAETIGYRVDGSRGVRGKDDIVRRGRVQEAANALACLFIGICRGIGEEMQAAMNIRVVLLISVADGVQHGTRLLRRGAVVEIDQRLAMHLPGKNGEIAADRLDIIECGFDLLVHISSLHRSCDAPAKGRDIESQTGTQPCVANQSSRRASRASTICSSSSSSITSAT